MPDTFEVELLLELLTDCPIPFWLSYSCKEGNQTNAGQSFQSAVDLAGDAMAVGINCTKPELITELLRSAKSGKPFIVYPNSGRVWDAKNKVWTGNVAAGFSNQLVNEWIEAGAQIIGGCCGIGAAQISEMSLSN
jgi:homocysteine S-methyltransferase